jgi:hypothetical protein
MMGLFDPVATVAVVLAFLLFAHDATYLALALVSRLGSK